MDQDSPSIITSIHATLAAIGSVLGLVVAGFGLWALGGAIHFAWGLVRDPERIGYLAKYFFETTKIAVYLPNGGEGLAHYVAWVAALLLLLVLGKLGFWAIGAGAALISPRRPPS